MDLKSALVKSVMVLIMTAKCSIIPISPRETNLQLWNRIVNDRTKNDFDLDALLVQYSLVCPLNRKCDILNITGKANVYMNSLICPRCYCNFSCAWNKSCCPGSLYGYLDVDCVNVVKLPHNRTIAYVMVSVCPASFVEPANIRQRCENNETEESVAPVTSYATSITYKNKQCALCNDDLDDTMKSWKLQVTCKRTSIEQGYRSFSQLKRILIENDCLVAYRPPLNHGAYICNRHHTSKKQIEQCNTTGLWQRYDHAIEWACNTLELRYREFKNVFCYICNPSVTSVKPRDLIESCNVTGRLLKYDQEMKDACLSMPLSERLYPFKNRYCALCNGWLQRNNIIQALNEQGIRIHASQKLYSGHKTQAVLHITLSNHHIVTQLKSFVRRFYRNETYNLTLHTSMTPQLEQTPYIPSLFESYFDVCGRHGCLDNTLSLYGENGSLQVAPNQVCGNCSCMSTCAELDTCCMDTLLTDMPYNRMTPNELGSFGNQHIEVPKEAYTKGFRVIDKCLNKTYQNKDIIDKCERWMEHTSGDVLLGIPVQTHLSSIPYRNVYCLICNNDNASTLKLSVRIHCDRYIEFQLSVSLDELVDSAVKYCRITFHPSNTRSSYMRSRDVRTMFLRYNVPSLVGLPVSIQTLVNRYMIIQSNYSTISTCNTTGAWDVTDDDILEVCENAGNATFPFQPYSINNVTYANFACFLCNPDPTVKTMKIESIISSCNKTGMWTETDKWPGIDIETMCNNSGFHSRWLPFSNVYCSICNLPPIQKVYFMHHPDKGCDTEARTEYPTYPLLFSLNPEEWISLQGASENDEYIQSDCGNGVIGPSHVMCQERVCSRNRRLMNGSCVPLINSISNVIYDVAFQLEASHKTTPSYSYQAIDVELKPSYDTNCTDKVCAKINMKRICRAVADAVTQKFTNDTQYNLYDCASSTNTPCEYDTLINISKASTIDISFSIHIMHTYDLMNIEETLTQALSALYHFNVNKSMTYTYQASENHNTFTMTGCSVRQAYLLTTANTWNSRIQVNKFLSCAQVQFSDNYYTYYNETKTIAITYITNRINVTLPLGSFKIVNSTLYACEDDALFDNMTSSNRSPTSDINHMALAYGIFSTTCRAISIACLLMTLLTYCLFKPLRTIPGKNNMTLVTTLLAAQLCLQFGVPLPNTFSVLCPLMGALTHFVWLATFLAMNVCCFHMFRVFHWQALVSPNVSAAGKQYLLYTLYVILSSILVVVCTIGGHLLASNGDFTGYGRYICFISERLTLILAFIMPSSIIFVSNIILFSLAFHKIRTSPHMGGESSSNNRRDLIIYVKLCTVVGLAWPLQLAASNMPLSVFTFVVEGVNALQGFFIFLAYVCPARVVSMYRERFCRCAQRYTHTATSEKLTQRNTVPKKFGIQNKSISNSSSEKFGPKNKSISTSSSEV